MVFKVYTKKVCPFCNMAKTLLKNKGYEYEEINVEDKGFDFDKLKEETGQMTVPQIFKGDKFIGGFSELKTYFSKK